LPKVEVLDELNLEVFVEDTNVELKDLQDQLIVMGQNIENFSKNTIKPI
jgi:hypothetical protein